MTISRATTSDGGAAAAVGTDAAAVSIGAEVEAVWEGIFKWQRQKSDMAELWLVVAWVLGRGSVCMRGDGRKMGNLAPGKEKKISRLDFFDFF